MNEFSNLSVDDLKSNSKKAITPLLNEYEIDHGTIGSSVNNVLFSPFEQSANLIIYQSSEAVGKLSVFTIDLTNNQFKSEFLEDIIIGSEVNNIAWSPETKIIQSLDGDLKNRSGLIKLAVTLSNYNEIQFISTCVEPERENDESMVKEFDVKRCSECINHHCINDIAFEPINGELLASTGDDKVCYLWNTSNGDLYSMFKLTSAGMSVKWHTFEQNKLMVAEKKGLIRFYDIQTKSAILSFSCDRLLLSADWCKVNNFLIASTCGSVNVFWNTAQSSYPTDRIKAHIKNGEQFSFFNDSVYASRGKPNSQILVQNRRTGQILFDREIKSGRGLSWHSKYPLLAVGSYNKVIIYHFAILS